MLDPVFLIKVKLKEIQSYILSLTSDSLIFLVLVGFYSALAGRGILLMTCSFISSVRYFFLSSTGMELSFFH